MGLFTGPRTLSGRPAPGGQARAMFGITSPADLIPPRPYLRPGLPVVTADTAMRHSAVWAALRVRADMISTMPLGVYRQVGGVQVAWPTPPVLVAPGGDRVGITEWLYSSQVDLDRVGNAFGLITERDGNGLPARIDLQQATSCSVVVKDGALHKYRIGGKLYDPAEVWHEKSHTAPGLHVGLAPVAYAAWSVGEYLTVQDFAVDWFSGGAVPRARLRNTAKTLNAKEATIVKEAWRASVTAGEPFVHGSDWEYDMIQAAEASADWINAKVYSVTDIARFFGVPADIIDAAPTGSSTNVRYANITQAHLQFLVIHLNAAIVRREAALTALTPRPRYVKFDPGALLRMDPAARANMIKTQIEARVLAPSEARELDDRQPFTEAQLAEFDRLFGPPVTGEGTGAPAPAPAPEGGQPELPPGSPEPALPLASAPKALPGGRR